MKLDAYFTASGRFKPREFTGPVVGNDVGVGPGDTLWRYESGVWREDANVVDRRCVRLLGNEYTITRSNTVERFVRHAQHIHRIPAQELPEAWAPIVNLRNTMIDWRDPRGIFEVAHHQDYLSTIQLPIDYDADATCPAFSAWLGEVVPPEVEALLWEVLGYLLMTGNPLQTSVLLLGPGGTGKSTFLRVLERMLGRENVSSQSLKALTENRFAASNLLNKSANIVGDIDATYMKDSSLFLQITGGDTMDAERKNKDAFSFYPFAVPVFSTNKVWRAGNDSDAYFRRWTILPFEHKVDRSKPFDEEVLYAEAPGIFNRAMDALRDLYFRTAPDHEGRDIPMRRFEVLGAAREAADRFAQESDPIRDWLAEDGLVTADAGNESMRETRATVYARYVAWCDENGIRQPKTGPEFYKAMRALGYSERKSHGVMMMLGIEVYVPGTVPA